MGISQPKLILPGWNINGQFVQRKCKMKQPNFWYFKIWLSKWRLLSKQTVITWKSSKVDWWVASF